MRPKPNNERLHIGLGIAHAQGMRTQASILFALATLTIATSAAAERPNRSGVTGGVAFGAGGGSGAKLLMTGELHIGYMVTPSTAVIAQVGGSSAPSGGGGGGDGDEMRPLALSSMTIVAAGGKHWISRRLWAQGSVGLGFLSASEAGQNLEQTGISAIAAVGVSPAEDGAFNIVARTSASAFSDAEVTEFSVMLAAHF